VYLTIFAILIIVLLASEKNARLPVILVAGALFTMLALIEVFLI
jgi:hypothetical protein